MRSAFVNYDIVHHYLGGKMRTSNSWAGALTLGLIIAFGINPKTAQATDERFRPTTLAAATVAPEDTGRTHVVFAGMAAAFAAFLILRRKSLENG